jgi:hypothetical protein
MFLLSSSDGNLGGAVAEEEESDEWSSWSPL